VNGKRVGGWGFQSYYTKWWLFISFQHTKFVAMTSSKPCAQQLQEKQQPPKLRASQLIIRFGLDKCKNEQDGHNIILFPNRTHLDLAML